MGEQLGAADRAPSKSGKTGKPTASFMGREKEVEMVEQITRKKRYRVCVCVCHFPSGT